MPDHGEALGAIRTQQAYIGGELCAVYERSLADSRCSNFPLDSLRASFVTTFDGFSEIAEDLPLEGQELSFYGTTREVCSIDDLYWE